MSGHGPDAAAYRKATEAQLEPVYLADTLAFMFESRFICIPTRYAMDAAGLQHDYFECWQGLKNNFRGRQQGK
jgi:homogentisate 1,2-dioxygenase